MDTEPAIRLKLWVDMKELPEISMANSKDMHWPLMHNIYMGDYFIRCLIAHGKKEINWHTNCW